MQGLKTVLAIVPKLVEYVDRHRAFGLLIVSMAIISLLVSTGVAYAMHLHEDEYAERCNEWNATRDNVFAEQDNMSKKIDNLAFSADKRFSVIEGKLDLLVSHLIK